MNRKSQNLLINFISCSNNFGWNREFDVKTTWKFCDGTLVTSEVIEFKNAEDWLETYDQFSDKLIEYYRGISFTDQRIVIEMQKEGNLLEFIFDINLIDGSSLIYRYVQFGEGNEAARTVDEKNLSGLFFKNWLNTTHKLENPERLTT